MRAREKVVRWHSPLCRTQNFELAIVCVCVHLALANSLDSLIQCGAGRPFHFTGISFALCAGARPRQLSKQRACMRCAIIKSIEWIGIKTFPAHVRPQLNFLLGVWKREKSRGVEQAIATHRVEYNNILLFYISLYAPRDASVMHAAMACVCVITANPRRTLDRSQA